MSKRWIVVGGIALVGLFPLVYKLLYELLNHSVWAPYPAAPASGFAIGALMVAHATMRPWREPLGASIVASAIYLMAFLAIKHTFVFSLAPTALLLISGTVAGAFAARRVAISAPGQGLALVLSCAVMLGVPVSMVFVVKGLGIVDRGGVLVICALAGVVVAGALVQSVLSVRRIWTIGGGTIVFPLVLSFARGGLKADDLFILFIIPLGALGARIAWRYTGARAQATAEVPEAQLR